MLRGIEVGDILNTPKEAVLLKGLQYEEKLENLRTMLIFKSVTSDLSDTASVNNLNQLLKLYQEAMDPNIVFEREKAVMSKSDKLKELATLDLSKLKYSKKVGGDFAEAAKTKKPGVIKII